MEEEIKIGNWEERLERGMKKLEEDPLVSERNRELILRYLRDARLGKTLFGRAKKKIGPARLLTNTIHLTTFLHFVQKDFVSITQHDMEAFIEALELGKIRSRRKTALRRGVMIVRDHPLSPCYQVDLKVTLRKFYKWFLGNGRTYPEIVEWIDTSLSPKEVSALTRAEVQRMIDRAQRICHRAMIQVLFDGGFRLSEFLNIRLRHVVLRSFDPQNPSRKCFFLRVPYSKTSPRTVSLPMEESTKWLQLWLEDHPARPELTEDGTIHADDTSTQLFPVTPASVSYVLRRFGKEAIKKRVYPHLMRHASATFWCNKLPYFKFCKRFGWTMTSKMPQRYIDREGIDEVEVAQIYHNEIEAKLNREKERLAAQVIELESRHGYDGYSWPARVMRGTRASRGSM